MPFRPKRGMFLVLALVRKVLPLVEREMFHWTRLASDIADPALRDEALNSIATKKFHVQGGSVYSLFPGTNMHSAVRFILALQTISDYLDNLCDRMGIKDEQSFRQLHRSMSCAVDPSEPLSDFYEKYPVRNDSQYLLQLVDTCRQEILGLPSYLPAAEAMKKHVELYIDLQSLKHLDPTVRENRMLEWHRDKCRFIDLSPWEFAAAAGSTLGMFMLFCAASDPGLTLSEVDRIDSVYLPWLNAFHILMDYYIDLEEDLAYGELNFVQYYSSKVECEKRLAFIYREAYDKCALLHHPGFHRTVLKGLLAMYLSDNKALSPEKKAQTMNILESGGFDASLYFKACRLLRRYGKI